MPKPKKDTFVPIWRFCKEKGINRQKLYRLIREHKIPPDKVKRVKIEVERIYIDLKTKV